MHEISYQLPVKGFLKVILLHGKKIMKERALAKSLEDAELSNGSEYEMLHLKSLYTVSKYSKYCSLYFPTHLAYNLSLCILEPHGVSKRGVVLLHRL